MSEGQLTTDYDKIRKWAEERGAVPATVKATEKNGEPGVLRLAQVRQSMTGRLH
jgi:hypothetical protein